MKAGRATGGHKRAIGALACAGMMFTLLAAQAPLAAGEPVETVTGNVKPPKAKKPSKLRLVITVSETAGPRPPQLTRFLMRFPAGAKVNRRAAAYCRIATLDSTGRCPSSSRIGKGSANVYVGVGALQELTASLDVYNIKPLQGGDLAGIVLHGEEPVTGVTVNIEGRVFKETSGKLVLLLPDIALPQVLGVSPAVKRVDVTTGKTRIVKKKGARKRRARGRKGKRGKGSRRRKVSYITNPPKCSGVWTVEAEFDYENGLHHTVTQDAPCKR